MMEKTVYKVVAQVETITVLPRTLEIKPEQMKLPGADATMFVVYGYDAAQRKVWCATFIDEQEAEAWVHGSKVFGRPVRGAVMAGQEIKAEKGAEMSDDATSVAVGDTGSGSLIKPN
jgi:hypothetical protein